MVLFPPQLPSVVFRITATAPLVGSPRDTSALALVMNSTCFLLYLCSTFCPSLISISLPLQLQGMRGINPGRTARKPERDEELKSFYVESFHLKLRESVDKITLKICLQLQDLRVK